MCLCVQLRAQFAFAGSPIVGDTMYGKEGAEGFMQWLSQHVGQDEAPGWAGDSSTRGEEAAVSCEDAPSTGAHNSAACEGGLGLTAASAGERLPGTSSPADSGGTSPSQRLDHGTGSQEPSGGGLSGAAGRAGDGAGSSQDEGKEGGILDHKALFLRARDAFGPGPDGSIGLQAYQIEWEGHVYNARNPWWKEP